MGASISSMAQDKNVDISALIGVSNSNLTESDIGLNWGIVSSFAINERLAYTLETSSSSYAWSLNNNKHKATILNAGFKYKINKPQWFAGIRLNGGLLFGRYPDNTVYDWYTNSDLTSINDLGAGWNVAAGLNYSVYLEKSHSIALSLDYLIGYGSYKYNCVTSLYFYDSGIFTSWNDSQKVNYFFYAPRFGITVLF